MSGIFLIEIIEPLQGSIFFIELIPQVAIASLGNLCSRPRFRCDQDRMMSIDRADAQPVAALTQ